MGYSTILGIDPGIATNTGLSIVKANTVGYSLIAAETIKTKTCDETGKRLSIIQDEIHAPSMPGRSRLSRLSVCSITRISPAL